MLRSFQSPGHAATLHPRGDHVLAGAFHGAAADRQLVVAAPLVVHALAVGFEVVDLALHMELTRFRGHIESEHERRDLPWRERIKRIHLSTAGRWWSW